MPTPPTPYVDLKTGTIYPPGTQPQAGSTLYWYNPNTSGGPSCSISIQGNWSSAPSPLPVPPQQWASSTIANVSTGQYSWNSNCCALAQPVHVIGSHPKPPHQK